MIDEPQTFQVGNDQVIFAYGRMVWYFLVNGDCYKVSRPELFHELPFWDELIGFWVQDRHRLWQWLKAREEGQAVLHTTPCWGEDENWDTKGFKRSVHSAGAIPVSPPLTVPDIEPAPKPPPKPLRRKYNEQYDPWYFEEHAKEQEAAERQKERRAAVLNEVRREQEGGVSMERRYLNALRPASQYKYRRSQETCEACGEMIANFLGDHHYIQAMFDLYSKERHRLL